MRRLLRRPLTWMIALECLLVAAAGFAAWRVAAGHLGHPAGGQGLIAGLPDLAPVPEPTPPPGASTAAAAAQPASGPTPGLRHDAFFLNRLNSTSAGWESAQWQVTSAVIAWIRAYVEGAMVPAMERAAGGARRAPSGPSPPPRTGPSG